ncbi:MAG TPA: tetratricopeptide repeat protein [Isosphaeraceae bacterium]|nr:tetratricopeptide repeat protein [Isosphaeraceae bacterium]
MARTRRRIGWALGLGAVGVAAATLVVAWAWSRPGADPLAAGLAAYERRDWPEAAARARERLRAAPDDLEARRLLARAAARQGRDAAARSLFGRLGGVEALRAEDLYLLGAGLLREQKNDLALAAFEQARAADPDHAEALRGLVDFYTRHDMPTAALPIAEHLARVRGSEAAGALAVGRLRLDLLDPAGAAGALRHAVETSPTPEARKLLARAWLESGKPAEARSALGPLLDAGSDREALWLASRAAIQQGRWDEAAAALKRARSPGSDEPTWPEPAPYVGAARCAECHAAIHKSQQASHHAETFTPPGRLTSIELPGRPVVDPADPGVSHAIERRGDGIVVTTKTRAATYHATVDYALGSGDRGLTFLGRDDDGVERELRISRYNDGSGWDRTTGHSTRPADDQYLGKALTADSLRTCLGCHATDPAAAADRSGARPESADRGIGCEACHGPGGHHVRAAAAKFDDLAIARPARDEGARVLALCGRCHAPRDESTADPNHPFFVKFQAFTLAKSRCYTASDGAFHCLTCHDPHRNASQSAAFYEQKCLSCHSPSAAGPKSTACPVNPSRDCLSCHMPVVKGAVPHTPFTDHYIRVRGPAP